MFVNVFRTFFVIVFLLLVQPVFAYQADENVLHRVADLPVDSRIIALLQQSKTEPDIARETLPRVVLTSGNFNAAENYLMLLIKANLVEEPDRDNKVIALLLQTEALVKKISIPQLNSRPFIDVSLMFAKSYSATKRFKKAYEHQNDYIDRYWESSAAERHSEIESIDEKYDTNQKNSENELLENQTKLKKLQLKNAENKKAGQLRNIIILIVTAITLCLFLFLQFSLKNTSKLASKLDYLTQLPNRKTLYKKGCQLILVMSKNEKNAAVLVIKIDGFSEINDEFGFDVGDLILQEVALLGRETMRARDFFARRGDAEFCAVLPEATLEQAKAISERLREKVAAIELSSLGLHKKVSISIGVASLQKTLSDFEQLVKAATLAMRAAQNNGKNQVLIYQNT
ncbi:MAG: diguanylate cyclase (GGDEF)-like protein [Alteromonadaceae bacterium]|jgi:diguanylate cyclase (GGDEF)-like protein